MTSKTKKILAIGLSLSLMMPASLNRRACAEQGSEPDTGCSRPLVFGDLDSCLLANRQFATACFKSLLRRDGQTPTNCGEKQLDASPSQFIGCNEEFQKCMDKPLSFWGRWKMSNRFWNTNYPMFNQLMILAGCTSLVLLGNMLAGTSGVALAFLLAGAYNTLFLLSKALLFCNHF